MKTRFILNKVNKNLVTKHFDIFDNGVILDLITPEAYIYMEFDEKHKCIELTKWPYLKNNTEC